MGEKKRKECSTECKVNEVYSQLVGSLLNGRTRMFRTFNRLNDLAKGSILPQPVCSDLKDPGLVDRSFVPSGISCT